MRINQLKKFGVEIKKSNTILGGEKIFTYNNKQLIVYKNFGKYCIAKLKDDCILFTMTGTKGKKDYFFTLLLKKEPCPTTTRSHIIMTTLLPENL